MDIYYEVIGEGYPIVFLHGNGEDHHIFDQSVNIFKEKYQCILIDSRYHGKSIHKGKLSYQQMCQDVQDVVSTLELQEYDVVGFSDGGILALLLASQDKRLKHLVSIGANTSPQMIKPIYRLTFFFQMICLLPFCLYHKKARISFQCLKLMMKEPHIDVQDLENIKIPALIMAGEHDMIKEEDTRTIAKSLPYSALRIIKQANHFLLRDSFEQTIHEITMFINSCHKEDL